MTERPLPLLSVRNLRLEFDTFDGVYRAIDGVSFDLAPGESLGIVGETGCGKSVTAKSILGLVPSPPARIVSGRILYADEDLVAAGEARLRALRGVEIAMIFQDPMTYLNPVFTIGQQLVDVIMAHQRVRPAGERLGRRGAHAHALEMLRRVRLPNPERQMDAYPYQLSGGMRQRVLIAQALSGNPRLLIADEPTTALDVTIQAQILDLIAELMQDLDLSVIMISHDLGVVASLCRRVIVMYAGQVVEDAAVARLFSLPAHPYTQGLLRAVPHPGRRASALAGIPGALPNLYDPPPGCRFQGRCPHTMPGCARGAPLVELGPEQRVACLLHAPPGPPTPSDLPDSSSAKGRMQARGAGTSIAVGAVVSRSGGPAGPEREGVPAEVVRKGGRGGQEQDVNPAEATREGSHPAVPAREGAPARVARENGPAVPARPGGPARTERSDDSARAARGDGRA